MRPLDVHNVAGVQVEEVAHSLLTLLVELQAPLLLSLAVLLGALAACGWCLALMPALPQLQGCY